MAAGGGEGQWIKLLGSGGTLVGLGYGLEAAHAAPEWALALLFAVGGLLTVFASCQTMILAVEGVAARLGWNPFVAGSMAGLASNFPEIVMLGFVLAAEPRVGFVVVGLAVHVGAMLFGGYSVFLPRDATGSAKMPEPLVKLSTDLFACAGGVYLTTGILMLAMNGFGAGVHEGQALTALDLYVLGGVLVMVEVMAVRTLITRFSKGAEPAPPDAAAAAPRGDAPSIGAIAGYGAIGLVASVLGGHAVGDFADILVGSLTAAGYPEMVGAILISVFACSGQFIMVGTAHANGMYDVALANASGSVTQVPFVVQPVALVLIGAFAQLGVTAPVPGGGALPIDLETTSVILLGFPPMLILWKAVQDDGKVSWVETASMVAIFGLILYFLAVHG
jgi:hypothetical protein